MFYKEGLFHVFFSFNDLTYYLATAEEPFGPYKDWGYRNLSSGVESAFSRLLSPYKFTDSEEWGYFFNGLTTVKKENNWFVLHQAAKSENEEPVLQVRELNWIKSDKITTNTLPFPAISSTLFNGKKPTTISVEDIFKYKWFFQQLTYLWDSNGRTEFIEIKLFEDHNLSGIGELPGEWNYNKESQILQLIIHWSESVTEYIYVQLIRTTNGDGKSILSGSGVNDGWWDHPGVWMKQVVE